MENVNLEKAEKLAFYTSQVIGHSLSLIIIHKSIELLRSRNLEIIYRYT